MTKVIIAPDSFKGSLTAMQAATIVAEAVRKTLPDAEIILLPLADGGEGTREVLTPFLSAEQHLIESAELIGLNLPEMGLINIFQRGTASLGDTILRALDDGKRDFIITLGGTATNDAGLGMLMSLGMEAWDASEKPIDPSLAGLLNLDRIDISNMDSRLAECNFTALADVTSPLYGEKGATAVYGPQKGVETSDIRRVDDAFTAFAAMCAAAFDSDPGSKEGAGAAGGLGYALMLLGGEVVSGAECLINATGVRDQLADADWIITGEGRSDMQTLQGKLPYHLALAARDAGVKVALLSGSVEEDALFGLGKVFDLVISAQPEEMSREEAISQAETLLIEAAACLAGRIREALNNS